MRGKIKVPAALVASLLLWPESLAHADVLAGILKCQVAGGPSLFIGSRRDVICLYKPNARGPKQYFSGTIERLGVAIGLRFAGTLMWNVHSELHDVSSLEGMFTGVGADAKFFAGPNEDYLVGGTGGQVTLKPLTAGGPTGFEVSAGIGRLNLIRTRQSDIFEGLDDDDLEK